jgi:hypothetical protein
MRAFGFITDDMPHTNEKQSTCSIDLAEADVRIPFGHAGY